MFALFRNWVVSLAACLVSMAGTAEAVDAGWVTIKNDTNRVLVVQCGIVANGHLKRGRPVRLLPGESMREFHHAAGLTLELFDGQRPTQLLHASQQVLHGDEQGFSVGTNGHTVVVTPIPRP